MKIFLLSFTIMVVFNSLIFAQAYILEWQSPDGMQMDEIANIGSATPVNSSNADMDRDGDIDLVLRDSNSLYVYDRYSYELIWSYTPENTDFDFYGFANLSNSSTREMILRCGDDYPYTIEIVNTTTNESITICDDADWFISIWNSPDVNDKLVIWRNEHIEVWGFDSQSSVNNNSLPQSLINLNQNYPNPFNPTTSINYEIKNSGFVNLKVYNVKGQLVETLVNQEVNAGKHSVIWSPKGISSGQYFYKISINDKDIQTKKAIILK